MPTPPSNTWTSDELALVERYLAGECADADAECARNLLVQSPGPSIAARLIAQDDLAVSPADVRSAWEQITQRIGNERRDNFALAKRPSLRMRAMVAGLALSCVGIVLLGGGFLYRGHSVALSGHQYQTGPGQRSTVRWADGSTVLLGPSTLVTVSPDGIDAVGEVYFHIAPHSARPWVVRTASAVVRVLGTQFGVRQYPHDRTSVVVVDEGKVALHATSATRFGGARHVILTAHTAARVTDSVVMVTRNISDADARAWMRGMLVFDRIALRDVVAELNRAYAVDIRIADTALAAQPVIMEVSVDEKPVRRVLELIGKMTNSQYTQDGRTYVITPRHAAHEAPAGPRHPDILHVEKSYGK